MAIVSSSADVGRISGSTSSLFNVTSMIQYCNSTTTSGDVIYFKTNTRAGTSKIFVPSLVVHDYVTEDSFDVSRPGTYSLPNGYKLIIENGEFRVEEKDGKISYRKKYERNFNPFLHASDTLKNFAEYCSNLGLSRKQFENLPIITFIMWLIVESALADGEDPPAEVKMLQRAIVPEPDIDHRQLSLAF